MEKVYDGSERRKFKRIVFAAKDEVMAEFAFPGPAADRIAFKIADIGAGGLRFVVSRDNAPEVSVRDKLILRKIKGKVPLEFVAGIELEVKWVMDHQMFDHLMIGCEFVNIAEDVRQQIDQFVESELARRNQAG